MKKKLTLTDEQISTRRFDLSAGSRSVHAAMAAKADGDGTDGDGTDGDGADGDGTDGDGADGDGTDGRF